MIRAAIVLGLVVALSFAARSFLPADATLTGSGAALAFGFLLLAALQVGHIFHALRLPHLTGFLLCGAIFGPEALGLITPAMVHDLGLVKQVAVGLIALNAGCELNFRVLRPRLRGIAVYSIFGITASALLLYAVLFSAVTILPFSSGMTLVQKAMVALTGMNALIALSPAVVMGIISETRAAGPLTELALSIVVLADLLVAVSFAFTSSLVRHAFPELSGAGLEGGLLWHIGGSMVVGALIGAVLALYIQRVGQRVALFVFALFFVVAEAAGALHLDPLMLGLSAGLFLENISPVGGHRTIAETEPAATPTFAVFFAVIGAEVHLHAFFTVAGWAVAAAAARAIGQLVGTRVGARFAGRDRELGRRILFGMLPQAGIALALANLVKTRFGAWGEQLGTLVLGTVVVNEMLGPIGWRTALSRAGEIGKREAHRDAPAPAAVQEAEATPALDGDAAGPQS
jgi:Kef-type K+ transport system membrane component KefB